MGTEVQKVAQRGEKAFTLTTGKADTEKSFTLYINFRMRYATEGSFTTTKSTYFEGTAVSDREKDVDLTLKGSKNTIIKKNIPGGDKIISGTIVDNGNNVLPATELKFNATYDPIKNKYEGKGFYSNSDKKIEVVIFKYQP